MIGLAKIDIPHGKQAVRAWRRLGWRTRHEVIQWGWRGLGHPDPVVAAIAVGRARVMLRLPLRRWVLVVVASLLVNWPLLWLIGRLIGGLDDQRLWLPISFTPGRAGGAVGPVAPGRAGEPADGRLSQRALRPA